MIYLHISLLLCICTVQDSICETQKLKTVESLIEYCTTNPDEPISDEEIQWNNEDFSAIKGIGKQALDDFNSITKSQCIIYYPLTEIVPYILLRALNGRENLIDPIEAHKTFSRYGLPPKDLDRILQEIDNLPADRLDAERKVRFIKFFRGFGADATLKDVKALFSYLYSSTIYDFRSEL